MSSYYTGICCSEDGSIVYACKYANYIYKSIDYGVIFNAITGMNAINWTCISCDFTGNYVIAGEYENVWISVDGYNFTKVFIAGSFSMRNVTTKPTINVSDTYIFGVSIYRSAFYLINILLSASKLSVPYNSNQFIYFIDSGFYVTCDEYFGYFNYTLNLITEITYGNGTPTGLTGNNNGLVVSSIPASIYISSDFLNDGVSNYEITNKWLQGISCTEQNIIYACNNNGFQIPYTESYIYKIYQDADTFLIAQLNSPFKLWKGICCSYIKTNSQDYIYAFDDDFIYYSHDTGNTWSVDCFLENTKIRIFKNNEIYDELIQNLKKGDLVMINEKDYRPIFYIGYNFLDKQKINYIAKIPKNKLYENYPNEDLFILTGHSLLFKSIPNEIKNEFYNQNIYNTTVFENYEKIIALHTNLYETPKLNELNIINNKIKYFHFALENTNLNEHYAIYSNNMQTETMTLNYIKTAKFYENI